MLGGSSPAKGEGAASACPEGPGETGGSQLSGVHPEVPTPCLRVLLLHRQDTDFRIRELPGGLFYPLQMFTSCQSFQNFHPVASEVCPA